MEEAGHMLKEEPGDMLQVALDMLVTEASETADTGSVRILN